jgi:hypothetical protein
MSDQPDRPRIVPPPSDSSTESSTPRTEVFTVPSHPVPADVIQFMRSLSKFMGLAAADLLHNGSLTAGNPAAMAMLNAAGTLEGTAMQWQIALNQQQQGGMLGGGPLGGGPSPMMPPGAGGMGGPFRTN